MNVNKKLLALAESAVCVALATGLSFLAVSAPFGGSITLCSTLPIIIISLRHNYKWGIGCALTHGVVQLLFGLSNIAYLPVKNAWTIAVCLMLDYILAFTSLGLTGLIAGKFKKIYLGITVGVITTGFLRFFCSFISGITAWRGVAEEGWNAGLWSLVYNGSWCAPDVIITLVVCLLLVNVPQLNLMPERKK